MFANKKQYSIACFTNLKINFIAIPKTGTSSFLTSLIEEDNPININEVLTKSHVYSHNKKFADYITPKEAKENNFLNISVLRNPIERLKSQYRDFFYGYKVEHKTNGSKRFNQDWLLFKKSVPSINSFLSFINSYSEEDLDMHFRSQFWFLKHFEKDNNFYCPLEHIDTSIAILNNIQNFNLKMYKRNVTNNIKDIFISKKTEEQIIDLYYKDLNIWENSKWSILKK